MPDDRTRRGSVVDLLGAHEEHRMKKFLRYRREFVELAAQWERARKQPRSQKNQAPSSKADKERAFFEVAAEAFGLLKEIPEECAQIRDPKLFKRVVKRLFQEGEAKAKAARKVLNRKARRLLRQFDRREEFGRLDEPLAQRSSRKVLRSALAEYLVSDYASMLVENAPANLPSKWVVDALNWKLEELVRTSLVLANRGDAGALAGLAEVVGPMVAIVNRKGLEKPSALAGLPHKMPSWPVLKSVHQDFDEDHEKVLNELEVGKGFPFVIKKESRWTARDSIGQWAIHLVAEVEMMQESRFIEEDPPSWLRTLATLKPFSGYTWQEWSNCVNEVLRREYVDVVEIPELNKAVKSKTDRKSPGRIRSRIFKSLKEKIRSLAGENKV